MKDWITSYPILLNEWAFDKNSINPEDASQSTKAIWRCKLGHEWSTTIHSRINGSNCPYCCNRKILSGYNDLKTLCPELAEEWNYEKNQGLTPDEVGPSVARKVWWKCKNGHEWIASINARNNKFKSTGCPYCSGKKVLSGYNDLKTYNPKLALEWNYEKNSALSPEEVTPFSHKKVWWKCKNGHEWIAAISDRNNGNNCPFCSGRYAISGITDIVTTDPEIASQWDYERNGDLKPEMFSRGSNKKVWWICEKHHEYQSKISNRIFLANGCPYCSGREVIQGFNDLMTLAPYLSEEWNFEKNGDLKPNMVPLHGGKSVWWKCRFGHEWKATINHRSQGEDCPECFNRYKTSFPEQSIFFYILKCYPDAINRYKATFLQGLELDIYIPSKKIGIEYDGIYWHKTEKSIKNEATKYLLCKQKGIFLIRFREKNLYSPEQICDYTVPLDIIDDYHSLDLSIKKLVNYLPLLHDIDICTQRDNLEIRELYYTSIIEKSFALKNPTIVNEWHPTKNGKLTPNMFSNSSATKVWWLCSKGHEYQARVSDRSHGRGCPVCSGKIVLQGYNDLLSHFPLLSKEWDYEKNHGLRPEMITPKSGKKVWWICNQKHSYLSSVHNRTEGSGCPFCANKKVWVGFNDLATTKPTIAKEWNYEKNNGLTPQDVTRGSNKKVWWKCSQGHEWEADIKSRSRGYGCPYCAMIE